MFHACSSVIENSDERKLPARIVILKSLAIQQLRGCRETRACRSRTKASQWLYVQRPIFYEVI